MFSTTYASLFWHSIYILHKNILNTLAHFDLNYFTEVRGLRLEVHESIGPRII